MIEEEAQTVKPTGWFSAYRLSNSQVWTLAAGRSLCQVGAGLMSFYIPIVFVNEVGLSATSVGLSVGLISLTEVAGHLFAGPMADSPRFGRKKTLLIAVGLSILVSFILANTHSLPLLIAACLLFGFSLGGYWTTVNAIVIDMTTLEERGQAYAIVSVADNLGIGIGVLAGGAFLTLTNQPGQMVFIGCGLIFLAFLLVVQIIFAETRQPQPNGASGSQGILTALKDRRLLVYFVANSLFTTYIALVSSTIPLYFTNFVPAVGGGTDSALANTANLFTWCYIGFGTLLQLPLAQVFNSFKHIRVLMIAMGLWAMGFFLVWITGIAPSAQYAWGVTALCTLSIASVLHKPYAAALLAELAPTSLRATYVSLGSQSWALGFFIGPSIGGWAMDQSLTIADTIWLVTATTTLLGLAVLWLFESLFQPTNTIISDEGDRGCGDGSCQN
ncbi:MFS transporter [Kovacikia minuta CCNUW1]|uniref:MFS transporter n=1 Tax=Kovacikia minuta TaxID=2931930 RepID=UPI001CCA3E52|nr:MFS transporter [Kovacikia minuta]UBF24479.1 MFS transporter [Kovacikia minuta CCNUW1]